MNRKKIAIVVAGMLGMLSATSQAAINIYSNEVERAEDIKNQGNYDFTQHGFSGEEAAVVKGFGKDMPLDLSLQIIIPKGWDVNLNEAAKKMKVDWKGKTTWPYVMESLAKDSNLQVAIDWERRVVDVFSKDAEEQVAAAKIQVAKAEEAKKLEIKKNAEEAAKKAEEVRKKIAADKAKERKEAARVKAAQSYAKLEKKIVNEYNEDNIGNKPKSSVHEIYKKANVLPLAKTEKAFVEMTANKSLKEFHEAYYILQEERMLSDNIKDWAKANGWRVVWNADADFRITHTVEIKGTMLNVVDQVISLYKKSKKPLMVDFYTVNKVIHVKDFNYDNK
jgi:hypothetical protein